MASTLPLILSAILVLLNASAMAQNNVLLTGQTLGPHHSQILYGDATFIMQGDCNLVLYNNQGGFQSNTHGNGVNCTLSFTDNGRLIIRRPSGATVWQTPNSNSPKGKYAAVVRPDRQVAIYGPAVWSTSSSQATFTKVTSLRNIPFVSNLLFSGQSLYDARLTAKDFSLVMTKGCNLVLEKGGYGNIWQSGTSGNGKYCFLRLDHHGRISILDDSHSTVFARPSTPGDEGEYVFILQEDGQAVIYGPVVWSTASTSVEDGEISMVTME